MRGTTYDSGRWVASLVSRGSRSERATSFAPCAAPWSKSA